MVAAFDYCLHGQGGAAPSIDTAMHGLVDAPHVDHLHPDAGIALATAADGEALTKECFGDRVLWVPWRRPGFQLGLDIARVHARQPAGDRRRARRPRHHRLGRDQRGVRGALAGDHPDGPALPRRARTARAVRRDGRRATSRCPRTGAGRGPPRWRRSSAGSPPPTSGRSATSPTADVVLDFLARAEHPRLAALGTSCPDHFLRDQGPADGAGPARRRPAGGGGRPAARAARRLPGRLRRLLRAARRRGRHRPCAVPTRRSCWCPGVGHVQLRQGQADGPGGRASSTSTRST